MPQDTPEAPASAAPEEGEPALLEGIEHKPLLARLGIYTRLSGPGWLQSAITLGGGSLGSSLYLGMLAGFALMWLQPLAMILGVIMLSAIGYVALSTGERPFRAINEHINPVLGWSWALATMMANVVWCLPQFSLGVNATRQNLVPSLLGDKAMTNLFGTAAAGQFWGKLIATVAIALICIVVIWFYDKGSQGIKIFEGILKIMVGIVLLCFFGVVVVMSSKGLLDWGAVWRGLKPNFSMLSRPAPTFDAALAVTGEYASYWSGKIVDMQRNVMVSAAATAVGINMTFLLPYSMLARGWRKKARGLAIFDPSTGLFIPFTPATGCVVIAAAPQFHAQYHPGLVGEAYDTEKIAPPPPGLAARYQGTCDARIKNEIGAKTYAKEKTSEDAVGALVKKLGKERLAVVIGAEAVQKLATDGGALQRRRDALPDGDKKIAAMITKRDAFNLAESLQPLTGSFFSHYMFGIGVLGMAISSIIILMLISGFVICEMLGLPSKGSAHRCACMLPLVGMLGPFIWADAKFWLVVPTSVFGMALLPIAYWTFFCMMNSRSLLGDNLPRGARRIVWNVLMLIAAGAATFGSVWVIWDKTKWKGIVGLGALLALALFVHVRRQQRRRLGAADLEEA